MVSEGALKHERELCLQVIAAVQSCQKYFKSLVLDMQPSTKLRRPKGCDSNATTQGADACYHYTWHRMAVQSA